MCSIYKGICNEIIKIVDDVYPKSDRSELLDIVKRVSEHEIFSNEELSEAHRCGCICESLTYEIIPICEAHDESNSLVFCVTLMHGSGQKIMISVKADAYTSVPRQVLYKTDDISYIYDAIENC